MSGDAFFSIEMPSTHSRPHRGSTSSGNGAGACVSVSGRGGSQSAICSTTGSISCASNGHLQAMSEPGASSGQRGQRVVCSPSPQDVTDIALVVDARKEIDREHIDSMLTKQPGRG